MLIVNYSAAEVMEEQVDSRQENIFRDTLGPAVSSSGGDRRSAPGPEVIGDQLQALMDMEADAEFLPIIEDELGWLFDSVPEARGTPLDLHDDMLEPVSVFVCCSCCQLVWSAAFSFKQCKIQFNNSRLYFSILCILDSRYKSI